MDRFSFPQNTTTDWSESTEVNFTLSDVGMSLNVEEANNSKEDLSQK